MIISVMFKPSWCLALIWIKLRYPFPCFNNYRLPVMTKQKFRKNFHTNGFLVPKSENISKFLIIINLLHPLWSFGVVAPEHTFAYVLNLILVVRYLDRGLGIVLMSILWTHIHKYINRLSVSVVFKVLL